MSVDNERTEVVKIRLQRADVGALVAGDETLRRATLFDGLGDPCASSLFASAIVKRYAQGAVVFREGEAAGSLFLVLRGEAELTASADGANVHVCTCQKGDHFGEEVAFGQQRGLTAQALTEIDVAEFPCAELLGHDDGRPLRERLEKTADARERARRELSEFMNRW